MNDHISALHKEEKYPCNECGRQFLNKRLLRYHLQRNHGRSVTLNCKNCEKVFPNSSSLSQHSQLIHGTEILKCEKCNYETKSKAYVRTHKNVHGSIKEVCSKCNYSSRRNGTLKVHMMNVHSEEKG